MSFLNFTSITIPSIFKKKDTLEYPFVKKEKIDFLKGKIAIQEDKCILCGKCQKACPCDAILVSRREGEWACDHFRCITCSSCIEACPKNCLSMDNCMPEVSREIMLDSHEIKIEKKKPNIESKTNL